MKINFKFNDKLEKAGLKVVKLLRQNNYQAFWVGGIVRNILLKRESENVDIATDAKPDDVEKVLKTAGIKSKPVGKQFGSVLAIVNKFPVEITTFRSESRYSDKRHPDQVMFIKEYLNDARRRDFTINTLYFDPIKKELYDPAKGIKDLGLKLLKFVGDPKKRIDEDALRMLRGARLATQLGFKLEKNSFAAIKTRAKYIQNISGERIKAELDKMLLSKNRVIGFELLDKTGLLKFIIPEFEILKTVFHGSKKYHLEGSVFVHSKIVLGKIQIEELPLIYAALLHDVGKVMKPVRKLKPEGWVLSYHGHEQKSFEIFEQLATRLRFPKKERLVIGWLIKEHDNWKDFLDAGVLKKYRTASHPAFYMLLGLWQADLAGIQRSGKDQDLYVNKCVRAQAEGQKWLNKIIRTKSLVEKLAKGDLIMKYSKLKPGPALGRKIEEIKIQIILGKIRDERDLKIFFKFGK